MSNIGFCLQALNTVCRWFSVLQRCDNDIIWILSTSSMDGLNLRSSTLPIFAITGVASIRPRAGISFGRLNSPQMSIDVSEIPSSSQVSRIAVRVMSLLSCASATPPGKLISPLCDAPSEQDRRLSIHWAERNQNCAGGVFLGYWTPGRFPDFLIPLVQLCLYSNFVFIW